MAINMGYKNRQAFALLSALAKELKGIETPVANIGDYINVFSELKSQFGDGTEFFNAVYNGITMKLAPISWNVSKASTPYSFIESTQDVVAGMAREGYVFSRELDEQTYFQPYFGMHGEDDENYGTVVNDEKITTLNEDQVNMLQWRKKDYPTEVLGTYGEANFTDHITVYRRMLEDSAENPYQFYNMFVAIKTQWLENWKEHKSMWETNTFMNLLVNTVYSKDTVSGTLQQTKAIKLLTEYNNKYGKNLTIDNWFKPENIKDFAPWAYIRINRVLKELGYKTDMYQTKITKEFRGKEYQWIYAVPENQIVTVFLEEPFDLMKSYSNAEVFNENDLAKVDVRKIAYWLNPKKPYEISVGKHLETTDGVVAKVNTPVTINHVIGIAYDQKAIATAHYGERQDMTPFNAVTEHANIWLKAKCSNYFNPYRKSVVFELA